MDYLISAKSEAGARPTNQDRLAYHERNGCLLMVLADGLGGYLRGDIAADMFVKSVVDEFVSLKHPGLTDPNLFLATVMLFAHAKLNQHAASIGITTKTPRTTGVACLIHNNCAYWAHVGDSRLYHFRNSQLNARTRDHTLTELSQDKTHLKFDKQSLNERLLSSIGGSRRPYISLSGKVELQQRDTIIACSDGIWRAFEPAELARYLDTPDLDAGVNDLLATAHSRAGVRGDNMSAIALRWMERSSDDNVWPATDPAGIDQERLWLGMQKQWVTSQDVPPPSPTPVKPVPKIARASKVSVPRDQAVQTLRELENLLDEVDQTL